MGGGGGGGGGSEMSGTLLGSVLEGNPIILGVYLRAPLLSQTPTYLDSYMQACTRLSSLERSCSDRRRRCSSTSTASYSVVYSQLCEVNSAKRLNVIDYLIPHCPEYYVFGNSS